MHTWASYSSQVHKHPPFVVKRLSSYHQTFRFPWQAYNRSMLYLTLDAHWYWLGGRGAPSSFNISAPSLQEWSKKDKADPQPGRLSSLLGSQVVTEPPPMSEEGGSTAPREWGQGRSLTNTVFWKLGIGTGASEAAVIPKGCQRVLEPLLRGGSDLMIIQVLSFHHYIHCLSALHTCLFPGLRGHTHHLHRTIHFNQKSGGKAHF